MPKTGRVQAGRKQVRREASAGRGTRGHFLPGVSGNPAGRPPGAGEVAQLRAAIAEHVPAIISAMVDKAKDGDAAAARLLLERVIAPWKAAEPTTPIEGLTGTFTEQGRAVLTAVAAGQITPAQAGQLLSGLGSLARTSEIDQLAARIEALEQGAKDGSSSWTGSRMAASEADD